MMSVNPRLVSPAMDSLLDALLALETREEGYALLEDLWWRSCCTAVKNMKISNRLRERVPQRSAASNARCVTARTVTKRCWSG